MSSSVEDFSLLGGPLHRLGSWLGLVRGTNTIALGIALGASCWAVVLTLTLLEGVGPQIFTVAAIGVHVRLLLAIPLFFACESWIDPRFAAFVREMVHAEIISAADLPALQSETASATRRKDAWLPEAVALLASVLMSLAAPHLHLPGTTALYDAGRVPGGPHWTADWYSWVCLTLFRFLMFRWLWRLALWCHVLWRLSRLPLRLAPTHPDCAGGLGYLEVVHAEFAPLVLAISAVQCASLAEEVVSGAMAFEAVYPAIAIMFLVEAALFLGPMAVFGPKLWATRVNGMTAYGVLGARYVNDFDRKWLRTAAFTGASPLGTPDLQSLADLAGSMDIVRRMQLVPVSRRMLVNLAAAALAPALPLLLLKYPVAKLAAEFFSRLSGL